MLSTIHLDTLWTCFVLAVAASCVSITITQTDLFAPMRAWVAKKNHMIGHLVQCFYCISHWIVFLLVVIYQPQIVEGSYLLVNLLVTAFFTICLATFISGLMFGAFLKAMNKAKLELEVKALFVEETRS